MSRLNDALNGAWTAHLSPRSGFDQKGPTAAVLALIQSDECAEVLRRGCAGTWEDEHDKTKGGHLRVRLICSLHGKFGDRTFPPSPPDLSDEIRMWVAGRRFSHKDEQRQAALIAYLTGEAE